MTFFRFWSILKPLQLPQAMPASLLVHLQAKAMPTSEEWQQAISHREFELKLDTDFDVLSFTGFLPCLYQGIKTGFEYFCEVKESAGSKSLTVEFITHSEHHEYLAAAIAAAVLAEMSNGKLEEPQEDVLYSGEEAIEWAKSVKTELPLIMAKLPQTTYSTSTPILAKSWWKFW